MNVCYREEVVQQFVWETEEIASQVEGVMFLWRLSGILQKE